MKGLNDSEQALGKKVRAFYATAGNRTRCTGEVVAYSIAPVFYIKKEDGTTEVWRADMCELLEDSCED